jgi:hypothetical protein
LFQGAGEVQNTLLERLRALEVENCNLTRDAELQRRQYERCLDDVANQVVRALLTQKVSRSGFGSAAQCPALMFSYKKNLQNAFIMTHVLATRPAHIIYALERL